MNIIRHYEFNSTVFCDVLSVGINLWKSPGYNCIFYDKKVSKN